MCLGVLLNVTNGMFRSLPRRGMEGKGWASWCIPIQVSFDRIYKQDVPSQCGWNVSILWHGRMLDSVLSRSILKCFFRDDDNPGQVRCVWTLSTRHGALCLVMGLCTLLCFCFYSYRILEYVVCSFYSSRPGECVWGVSTSTLAVS